MATGPTKVHQDGDAIQVWKWTGITLGDTMEPILIAKGKLDDVTAYLFGTVSGGSPSLALHGSPERNNATPTLFAPLSSGTAALALSAANTCGLINETAAWYKPVLTGGDGSTSLSFWLVVK